MCGERDQPLPKRPSQWPETMFCGPQWKEKERKEHASPSRAEDHSRKKRKQDSPSGRAACGAMVGTRPQEGAPLCGASREPSKSGAAACPCSHEAHQVSATKGRQPWTSPGPPSPLDTMRSPAQAITTMTNRCKLRRLERHLIASPRTSNGGPPLWP